MTAQTSQKITYQPPAVTQRGKLQQFSGSPLSTILNNPVDLPQE